ncbi:hypothetical protein K0M31_000959 [Melipona bicolor]|uniref:Uncharacterized protein n=1 Tax=Melipona bicolor TaxID=60889 RepID=A0AA40KX85_9HYME|nr:hypothetical protein K0M31_000959 [Melipona bicolor]
MSASMRSTLQTVPESVPADHVTNSKKEKGIAQEQTRQPFRRSIMCLVTQNVLRVWLKVEQLRLEEGVTSAVTEKRNEITWLD